MASFSGNCITEVAGGIPVYHSSDDLEPAGAIGVSGPSQDVDEELAGIGLKVVGAFMKNKNLIKPIKNQ